MSKKLLTIITVTKNCADTIARTLHSVSLIKTPEIEYLVVDGASQDGTLSIIQQYTGIIDQLSSERDNGIYNAMNKGVAKAQGEYILFINGDDQIEPDGFRAVVDVLRVSKENIVCATTIAPATNETLVARPSDLLFHNAVPHPSSFVHAELLRSYPFREDLKIASDYDFFLYHYMKGYRFLILPFVTAVHTRGGASGDTARTLNELKLIRKKQMGLLYFLINLVDFAQRLWRLALRIVHKTYAKS